MSQPKAMCIEADWMLYGTTRPSLRVIALITLLRDYFFYRYATCTIVILLWVTLSVMHARYADPYGCVCCV